jgi:hypothetical protein
MAESDVADWIPLNSTALVAYKYDNSSNVLQVRFSNGREYNVEGVPPDTVQALVTAKSIGQYFVENIRGRYPESEIL